MNYENRLNDQRRMWKFLLFGILTLGIYQLVFLYKMNNDINTACNPVQDEDEFTSPNYIIVILLSIITLGIYTFFWYYKQGITALNMSVRNMVCRLMKREVLIFYGYWLVSFCSVSDLTLHFIC